MPSHLSDIGFDMQSEEEFQEVAYQAFEKGENIKVSKGAYVKWSPGEGIELWLQLDRKGDIIGMNPHFAGTSLMRVGLTKRILRPEGTKLDGAFYGWANPSADDPEAGDYPFVFDVPDYGMYEAVKLPCVLNVQMAAFAHELNAYESDEAYDSAQSGEAKFAPEAFIPSGLFNPDGEDIKPPEAYAILSGHVIDTSMRTNPITNSEFCWAKVQTYGGEMEVVADPLILNGSLVKGGVISGTFWLSGRLLNYPINGSEKMWQRFFKR